LAAKYGRSFEEKNLRRMMQFAEQFTDLQIVVPLARQLSWSHFLMLIPLKTTADLIPDDGDLKQMFVYNLFWKCARSILLYPAVKEISGYGDYHDFTDNSKFNTQCSVATVSVLDNENSLDKKLGFRVLESLFKLSI
jgi:hypothetical protein